MLSTKLIRWFALLYLMMAASGVLGADLSAVILLHGKEGSPQSKYYKILVSAFMREGFQVRTPEMPWSSGRKLNRSFDAAMEEIDDVAKELRSGGIRKVFVAGHSLGANGAICYGARYESDGILAIAPGHSPELKGFQSRLGDSVERAKRMVQAGESDKRASFNDINQGKEFTVETTAKIYLSYTDPAGSAVMPKNAKALRPGTPLLWVIGTDDPMYQRGQSYVFDKAPTNPANKYVVVKSNHLNTPSDAVPEIIAWLKALNP